MRSVYITRLSKFFPNSPVPNEEMEHILEMVNDTPSKARPIILRNNGIKKRYYAFRDGKSTHTNAQLAAIAVKGLFDDKLPLNKLQLLAVGTTSPEQMLPSHASMIHGELGTPRVELISAQGACCSSIQALKYAYMSVAAGLTDIAVGCGSEKMSTWMHASRFEPETDNHVDSLKEHPIVAFEKDFLRWMLSDGAGAALLQPEPASEGRSLKIEWIEITSFADELETCMYSGAVKNKDKTLTGFNEMDISTWTGTGVFALKQDTRLLGENVVPKGGVFLKELMEKHHFTADDIDYFLPHMSSEYFKDQVYENLKKIGLEIPMEKWFYNLTEIGNIGSASPYLMLEELFHSDRLKKGDRILVMVPESARFSYAYIYLTVV